MIYYIGDTHFGHENVIKYDNRPFTTVEEMDNFLIEKWNSKVNDEDHVYIIGDFVYRSNRNPSYYLKQLKGHKHLIIGNHDVVIIQDEDVCMYFESIEKLGYVKDGKTDVVMCHYPILEWNGRRRKANPSVHIYAHIHNRKDEVHDIMSRIQNAYNAGCMVNGYEPCTLEELREKE